MLLLEGEIRPIGAQPDGDSVRFYPNDPSEWDSLPGPHRVRTNSHGGAQLRLDAIDALETHYPSQGGHLGTVHQPLQLARAAATEALDWLGFTGVVRSANETVTAATPQAVQAYLLSRTADRNGRCVAFLFRGAPPAPSGTSVQFTTDQAQDSLNYHLLERGLAYPTYYTKLYPDVRETLTAVVQRARPDTGLWPEDVTTTGVTVDALDTLFDRAVILPKLFRRLVDYLALGDGDLSLGGFSRFLAAKDDRMFIISTGHATGFDYVVAVDGQQVRLTRPPEDLVFVEA
jgi:hypothetical protein